MGLDMMRQLAPETLSLDRVFGFGRMTAAWRRGLEADPSWNNGLAGGWRGCKNDELLATELDCTVGDAMLEGRGGQRNWVFGQLIVLDTN